MSECGYHLMQRRTEQLSITEHKVFDGRKFKTDYKPLLEKLPDAPCTTCGQLFVTDPADCDPKNCQKITTWLTQ